MAIIFIKIRTNRFPFAIWIQYYILKLSWRIDSTLWWMNWNYTLHVSDWFRNIIIVCCAFNWSCNSIAYRFVLPHKTTKRTIFFSPSFGSKCFPTGFKGNIHQHQFVLFLVEDTKMLLLLFYVECSFWFRSLSLASSLSLFETPGIQTKIQFNLLTEFIAQPPF